MITMHMDAGSLSKRAFPQQGLQDTNAKISFQGGQGMQEDVLTIVAALKPRIKFSVEERG